MVSPLNPGGVHSYDTLIKVAVHEFTHFIMKSITSSGVTFPVWLHEGVATYEARQTELLNDMGKWVKRNSIPSLSTLESPGSLEGLADNNLYPFSYTLVEYIINEYGIEKLNAFIRAPWNIDWSRSMDLTATLLQVMES